MGVEFCKIENSQEKSWDYISSVLSRLEIIPSPERLAAALNELSIEVFSLDRTALFWKAAGYRTFRRLDGPLPLPIDPAQIAELTSGSYFPGISTAQVALGEFQCETLYFKTSTDLEILFVYTTYTPTDRRKLETTLRIWAMRWEKALAEQEKASTALQLAKIRSVTEELGKGMDYKPLLSRILKMTLSLVDADHGFIMIVEEATGLLKTEVVHGLPNPAADRLVYEDRLRMSAQPTGQGVQARVMLTRQPVMIEKITDFSGMGVDQSTHSIICVPLVKQDQAFGVIYVTNKRDAVRFSPQDLDLVCILSSNVASVVDQVRLFNKSITDYLTGLYLRRHFEPKLDHEVKRSIRYGCPLSVLALDADHFKRINDTFGHQAGDCALKAIADIIRRNVRTDVDLPARMGGEEFAVLLPETNEIGAISLAERIRRQMEQTLLNIGGDEIRLTLSIGIATCPHHGDTLETLLENADRALYASKDKGRNRVTSFTALQQAAPQVP